MANTDKTAVRFRKTAPPYLSGEVAAFSPDQAADLVARGVAERYEPDAAPGAVDPKDPPKKGGSKPADTVPAA